MCGEISPVCCAEAATEESSKKKDKKRSGTKCVRSVVVVLVLVTMLRCHNVVSVRAAQSLAAARQHRRDWTRRANRPRKVCASVSALVLRVRVFTL
jgi:hypothetical protein